MSKDAQTTTTTVQVMCPNLGCRKILSIPEDARGSVVKCQHCQTLLKVPDRKPPGGR